MSFGSMIVKHEPYIAPKAQHRFEFVDRDDANSGNDAMLMYEWATTWGKACGGWMVFEDEATMGDWLRNW